MTTTDCGSSDISGRVRRIEALFFIFVVSFITYMSTSLWMEHNRLNDANDSTLNDLQEARSSLHDIQDAISSLRETQNYLIEKIEKGDSVITMNGEAGAVDKNTLQKKLKSPKHANRDIYPPFLLSEGINFEKPRVSFDSSGNFSRKKSRKLEDIQTMVISDNESTSIDCIEFVINFELDEFSSETTWTLIDEVTQTVIENITYTDEDSLLFTTHTLCLGPSKYSLTIFDKFGDGIFCSSLFEGKPCYSYTIDGTTKEGALFEAFMVQHRFDTTRACILDPMMLLRLHFNSSEIETDITLTSTTTGETTHSFIVTTDPFPHENATETLYLCLNPGIYKLSVEGVNSDGNFTTCENGCYDISIEENSLMIGPNSLDGETFSFYVNKEWAARERKCDSKPIISAINDVSSFSFDDRVSKILNVLQALSSFESMFAQEEDQYRATCFILYDDVNQIGAESPFLPQRYVLALFLYATNQTAELWLPSNACTDIKFSCNEQLEITAIDWSKEGLGGTIPTEIALLTKLETLKLNNKDLKGSVPSEIIRLTNLKTLEMESNDLTGTIPSTFGLMKNLQVLNLFTNRLSGPIPSELGNLPSLENLFINSNEFTGSIPPEIFNNDNLMMVEFSKNKLTGSIPSEIALCNFLWIFFSVNNHHTGSIPSEIGDMSAIFLFDISNNMISGTIPMEIKNVNWWVEEIRMDKNKLTGTLPPISVQGLLYVSQNMLTGDIPEEIWDLNVTGLKLEDNELRGNVSDSFCANLSFVDGFEEEGIYDLTVDDSPWFIDTPLVTCPCCDDVNCHLWKNGDPIIVGGTRKPSCPATNLFKTPVYELYILQDLIADIYTGEGLGIGKEKDIEFCLSPTGCFEMRVDETDGKNDFALSYDRTFRFGYSAATNGLLEHDECDAVDICGTLIAADDPKRMGLNHLTHIALADLSFLDDSSSDKYKAICWIMTQDKLFHEFDICDGTLLQRYVMTLLYYSMQENLGFDVLPPTHTCDWLGVTCDPSRRFVEKLEIRDRELSGTLITEIGLLTRLKTLNLSHNQLNGTLDVSIFEHLPDLEVFDLGQNELGGIILSEMVSLPSLKTFNISNNLIVGGLPFDVSYARNLESFDVENNLLVGVIPDELIACWNLIEINLSRNNFKGTIPAQIGILSSLKTLKLNQNSLSGSLPFAIFNAKSVSTFQVQANFLTGSIPSTIGNLKKATFIAMNHNSLKGPIPKVFEDLEELQWLHLHQNALTGEAPNLPRMFELGEVERYMTDCGSPSYALAKPISCETCTTCCNSDEMCQTNRIWPLSIVSAAFIVLACVPIVVGLLLFIFRQCLTDSRDPGDIVDKDSTYCLFFSDSKLAWFIHLCTFFVQGCFYYLFLLASSFTHTSSDWQFTIRCPPSNVNCNDENTVSNFGWFLFYLITLPTLGIDFMNSFFQIRKAAILADLWLFCSGSLHLGMTILAVFASVYYNLALATSNNELILNAVILLFINDLDEQFMDVVGALAPDWVELRNEEIGKNILKRAEKDETDDHRASGVESGTFVGNEI